MPRYQLQDKCLFVDAYLYDKVNRKPRAQKKPDLVPYPHINDQRVSPATYLRLNDGAAFITRFIVLGVDTDLIPQIVDSEYQGSTPTAVQDVANVVAMLMPYLEPRTYQRPYQHPQNQGVHPHAGGYPLDFSVNWFGTGGLLKGPL
jgi:hypothetical protein